MANQTQVIQYVRDLIDQIVLDRSNVFATAPENMSESRLSDEELAGMITSSLRYVASRVRAQFLTAFIEEIRPGDALPDNWIRLIDGSVVGSDGTVAVRHSFEYLDSMSSLRHGTSANLVYAFADGELQLRAMGVNVTGSAAFVVLPDYLSYQGSGTVRGGVFATGSPTFSEMHVGSFASYVADEETGDAVFSEYLSPFSMRLWPSLDSDKNVTFSWSVPPINMASGVLVPSIVARASELALGAMGELALAEAASAMFEQRVQPYLMEVVRNA